CRCFCHASGVHPDLHSFPTRRSSDLKRLAPAGRIFCHSLEILLEGKANLPVIPSGRYDLRYGRKNRIDSSVVGTPTGQVRIKTRSEEHTSELQSRFDLVCRLLLEKKN